MHLVLTVGQGHGAPLSGLRKQPSLPGCLLIHVPCQREVGKATEFLTSLASRLHHSFLGEVVSQVLLETIYDFCNKVARCRL